MHDDDVDERGTKREITQLHFARKQKQTKWFNTQLHPNDDSSFWLLVKCILFAIFFTFAFHWILSQMSGISSVYVFFTLQVAQVEQGMKKKTVLYILFHLTCWRECVSYYVKRNRFWRCFQANEGAWNGAWVKKCLFTRYLAAYMPVFVTAVCVVFYERPWIQYLSLKIKCIHQKHKYQPIPIAKDNKNNLYI